MVGENSPCPRGAGYIGKQDNMTDFPNFVQKSSYAYEELIECARGNMFGKGNAQLPMPPMLMVDRITSVTADGGAHGKGQITAEFDVRPDLWFFDCHFEGYPIMPGCLGLDGMWQLLGFFLGWMGGKGQGGALGVGEVKLTGKVLPSVKKLTFKIDLRRVIMRKLVLGIGEGIVEADGEQINSAKDLKVGLFAT